MLTACSSERELGKCVGINGKENPALVYQYDARNIAVAIIFSELVIPPVLVVLDSYKCPIAKRQ